MAETLLAKAQQECPASGLIWALAIDFATRQRAKDRCVDALKKCDNDPLVFVAVAKVFWADRRLEKAKMWLERAIAVNPKYGDAWAYLYMYARQNETPEVQAQIIQRCTQAEPNQGDVWRSVSKTLNWILDKNKSTSELLQRVTDLLPQIQ